MKLSPAFVATLFHAFLLLAAPSRPLAASERIALEILPAGGEGGQAINVIAEIASTPEARETGLMGRRVLPAGSGMIFIYPRDERMSFWMKNTRVPLSIAFIDSRGVFREIFDMKPFDLTPVKSSGFRRFALEVPQGWFSENGIAAGSTLSGKTLEKLKAIPAFN